MEYTKQQEIVNLKFCRKCFKPLNEDSLSDGFCDVECRKEFFQDNRKLAEEIISEWNNLKY